MKSFDPRFSPRYRPPRSRSVTALSALGGLMRGRAIFIAVILGVLAVAVYAGSRGDDGPTSDDRLQESVVDALTRVGYGELEVTMNGQGATIAGQVATEADLAIVEGIALSVRDVTSADVVATVDGAPAEEDPLDPGEATAVEVDVQHDLTQLTTLDPIRFESGDVAIAAESLATLDLVALLLNSQLDIRVSVEGHTDADGEEQVNQELSTERAGAVVAYLQTKGVDVNRLTAVGFGSSQPIAPNETQEGKERNRRIEFRVLTGDIPLDLTGATTTTTPAGLVTTTTTGAISG